MSKILNKLQEYDFENDKPSEYSLFVDVNCDELELEDVLPMYTYLLRFEGNIFYNKVDGDDDFLVFSIKEHKVRKVDHNGESLFFTAQESKYLQEIKAKGVN